jgi:hypothetical protein
MDILQPQLKRELMKHLLFIMALSGPVELSAQINDSYVYEFKSVTLFYCIQLLSKCINSFDFFLYHVLLRFAWAGWKWDR